MSETSQDRIMTIATNLKRIREAKRLTQREVWEAAGIGKSSLTAYEAGRSDPTGDTIVKLAKALGVTTDELLLTDQERSIPADLIALFREISRLPEADQGEIRRALKGHIMVLHQMHMR